MILKKINSKILIFCESFFQDKTFVNKNNSYFDFSYVYFILVIIFYSTFNVYFNSWSTSGEMWAEMATNYYKISQEGTFLNQLFAPDAGYTPLLQRIVAFLVSIINTDFSFIPYLYTWSAIILSAILVGSFCLNYFRSLIESDLTRFLISLIILLVIDWESATFINFTYLNTFFISIFIAVSLQKNVQDAPLYAFIIPLLVVNKVYILVVFPLLLLSLYVVKKRYRIIFFLSLIMSVIQIFQVISNFLTTNSVYNGEGYTFISKIISSFYYFFVYNLRDLLGFDKFDTIYTYSKSLSFILGFLFVSFAIYTIYRKKNKVSPFILIGLTISYLTYFLNTVVHSPMYTIETQNVILYMNRHLLTGFIGFLFIFTGVIISWSEDIKIVIIRKYLLIVFLFLWVYSGSWIYEGIKNIKPGFITSKWQDTANLIDYTKWQTLPKITEDIYNTRPCIPLDPYPWVYNYGPSGENIIHCDYLTKISFGIGRYNLFKKPISIEIPIDDNLKNFKVKTFMAAVKSYDNSDYILSVFLNIKMKNSMVYNFMGQQSVNGSNNMIIINSKNNIFISIKDIDKITLTTNFPIIMWSNTNGIPILSWMGVKK